MKGYTRMYGGKGLEKKKRKGKKDVLLEGTRRYVQLRKRKTMARV